MLAVKAECEGSEQGELEQIQQGTSAARCRGRSDVLGSYAVGYGVITGLRTVIYLPLRLLSIEDWKRECVGALAQGACW